MDREIWFFLAGIFFSLITGYIVEYTSTPLAKKYRIWRSQIQQEMALKSVVRAKQRIANIQEELRILEWFVIHPTDFNAFAYRILQQQILNVALLITSGVLLILFYPKMDILSILIMLTLFVLLYLKINKEDKVGKASHIFDKISHHAKYKEEMLKQMAELQRVVDKGTP